MKQNLELRRFILRDDENLTFIDDTLTVKGLVNKTEEWSKVLGNRKKFIEKIRRGAFSKALANTNSIDFLFDHDKTKLLATTDNHSLELYEDDEGLKMSANILKTSYGQDAFLLIKDNVINHMSFGFKVINDTWTLGENGIYERVIEELALTEVSAVRNPAYSQSAIEARGIALVKDIEISNIKINNSEERNMELKNLKNIVGDNKGNGINQAKGEKVDSGFNVANEITTRVAMNAVLNKCNNIIADSNTGIAIFPIVNEDMVNYIEVKAVGIENDIQVKDEVYNATINAESTYKNHLKLKINQAILDKVALKLDLVESESNELMDIFTIKPEFVDDNYLICNSNYFERICKMKDLSGNSILKYKKIDSKLVPTVNNVEIVVNDNMTKVVLFNPTYIGVAHLSLDECEEVITTNLRRAGLKMFRQFTGAEVELLIKESAKAITIE